MNVDNYIIPKNLKKTTKYTEEQKNKVIILYENGKAIRQIARELPMSRRMIQFILFPERLILAKQNFAKRQKEGRYRYPTKIQSEMIKKVRERKRKMIDKLIKKH